MQWCHCTNTASNICGRNSRNMESINSQQYSNRYICVYTNWFYLRDNGIDHGNGNTTDYSNI